MATLNVEVADRGSTAITFQAVAATTSAEPDTFANTGKEFLFVKDTDDGGSINLVITGSVDGQTPTPKSVTVPASTFIIIGPFPQTSYSSTMQVYAGASSDIEVGVIRV